MTIGERIKNTRKQKGLTQTELGNFVGATRQTICKYEKGTVTAIPYETITGIANVLNVSPGYLLGWNESSGQNKAETIEGLGLTEEEMDRVISYAHFLLSQRSN